MKDIQKFYDSILLSLEPILDHLNKYSLENLPEAESNLLLLVLGFVEASISVEMFEQPEVPFGVSIERFQPLHNLVR
jgi:hypothetical protein